jgi:hypothetical protein
MRQSNSSMTPNETLENSKVTRIDRGVYRIRSQSQKGVEYTVDLFDNDGFGGCDCKKFQFSSLPKFERNGRIPFDYLRCKHLRRVRSYVLDAIIQVEIQKEKQPNKKGKKNG